MGEIYCSDVLLRAGIVFFPEFQRQLLGGLSLVWAWGQPTASTDMPFCPCSPHAHTCLQGRVSRCSPGQSRSAGPSSSVCRLDEGGAATAWSLLLAGSAASPSPPRACVARQAFHSDPNTSITSVSSMCKGKRCINL